MKKILAAFAANTVFANIVILIILFAGGLAATNMLRESFPQFSADMISIQVTYPGADPEEIEEGISLKIEDALQTIEGIKQYTSHSSENMAAFTVEILSSHDIGNVLEQIKTRTDAIATFPDGAERPVITEILLRNSVMMLSLSGNLSEKQLKIWANRVKDEIKRMDGISQVEVFGSRDYEISIEISEENLQKFDLTLEMIAREIRKSALNLHGGTIRTDDEEIRIRTVGRKYSSEELAEIIVLATPDGGLVPLGRIADIQDGFTEDPILALIDGTPAVFVMVFKTENEDALKIAEQVNHYITDKQQQLPSDVFLTEFYDYTKSLKARIDLLSRNGIIGLGLVFFLLWLFLDLRLAFWAGLGIPISLAGGLVILWGMGETINMISLFGFLVVLGIVVDDAIVVGESIYFHRKQGKAPLQAAVDGVTEIGMPVTVAVITSIIAFIPIAFAGGILGKFIAILPVVVIACLIISLIESLFLLPAHLSNLTDLNRQRTPSFPVSRWLHEFQQFMQQGLERFIENRYSRFLDVALKYRFISLSIAIALLILTIGLMNSGLIKVQIFPKFDGFVITSTVEFPAGTSVSVTSETLKHIESSFVRAAERMETVSGEPMIKKRLSLLGQTLGDSMGQVGPHIGSVQIILLDSEKRGIHSNRLMVEWEKEIGQIVGAKSLTFEGLSGRGGGGAEIEIWLQGNNMPTLIAASENLKEKLATYDGVLQIKSDYSQGKNELRVSLKPEARTLGLTVDDLARQVNAAFFGKEAYRLQRGEDDIRVKVRYPDRERSSFNDFHKMRIRTPDGREMPLTSVADIEFSPGYATITRTDGMRRIAVTAEVDPTIANSQEIFADLGKTYFPQLKSMFADINVSMQGEKKNMRESLTPLITFLPIAMLGIYVIIAAVFRSYIQPLVILFTIPFGLVGAVAGHFFLGYNLSMMSMFGMVALTGVVINGAIVLIERINKNLSGGMDFLTAVKEGSKRRFRAIILTSLSTIGGLTPLILETDLQARFIIPMALSLAAGVAFATVLTLVLIPSLLTIVNDLRRITVKLGSGQWPSREEVEQSSVRN
jgi:multidrug efflux pump subunit AcrB